MDLVVKIVTAMALTGVALVSADCAIAQEQQYYSIGVSQQRTPEEEAAYVAKQKAEADARRARAAEIAARENQRQAEIDKFYAAERQKTLVIVERMAAESRAAAWARKLRAKPPLPPCRGRTPCAIPM